MKQHKYDSLLKFVHLDGIKEIKETNPDLFSEDGISTKTLEIDNGKNIPVTMYDAKNACEMFLQHKLNINQFQQWGEWIHMMDFFELEPNGEAPDFDESLINIVSEIDNIDLTEESKIVNKVEFLLSQIESWIKHHKN